MIFDRKKIYLVFASLFTLTLASGALAAGNAPPRGQPFIFVAQPGYDFGQAMEGAEVVHEFIVKNTGAGVLNIDRVKTS